MGASRSWQNSQYMLSKSPFLYINDPTVDTKIVHHLCELIPRTLRVAVGADYVPFDQQSCRSKHGQDFGDQSIFVFIHDQTNCDERSAKASVNAIRDAATGFGRNFASINIYWDESSRWISQGPNHLNFPISNDFNTTTAVEAQVHAQKIYEWLFTVLTVKETLHLIPDEQMRKIDPGAGIQDFEYCSIVESRKRPKDAKIQFVVLVVSKPEIEATNRLTWQVADKSGVANFYFNWRDSSSQSTWDWVLSFKPGQRACLPRMPCVLIKERLAVSVLKAPIRIPGVILAKSGDTIRTLGGCVKRLGRSMALGKRERWVSAEDLVTYLDADSKVKAVVPTQPEATGRVSEDTGKTTIWRGDDDDDDGSSSSTLQGENDEKWYADGEKGSI